MREDHKYAVLCDLDSQSNPQTPMQPQTPSPHTNPDLGPGSPGPSLGIGPSGLHRKPAWSRYVTYDAGLEKRIKRGRGPISASLTSTSTNRQFYEMASQTDSSTCSSEDAFEQRLKESTFKTVVANPYLFGVTLVSLARPKYSERKLSDHDT